MTGTLIHATCIAAAGRAVLIRGPSGSGKSDLALRCLATAPSLLLPDPARLVADDQVMIERNDSQLWASCPASIEGLIEVRGLGIVPVAVTGKTEVVLIADLLPRSEWPQRLPDPPAFAVVAGLELNSIAINPFEPSAPIKLLMALTLAKAPRVS